jgi:hypothetical protein
MADHLSRKAVTSITRMAGRFHALAYASIPSPFR